MVYPTLGTWGGEGRRIPRHPGTEVRVIREHTSAELGFVYYKVSLSHLVPIDVLSYCLASPSHFTPTSQVPRKTHSHGR